MAILKSILRKVTSVLKVILSILNVIFFLALIPLGGVIGYVLTKSLFQSEIILITSSNPPDAILRGVRDFFIQNPTITAGIMVELPALTIGFLGLYAGGILGYNVFIKKDDEQ